MLKKTTVLFLALIPVTWASAQVQIEWTSLVGVDNNTTTNTLYKTASNGWNNAGARSLNRLDANEDGKMTYMVTELDSRKAIGLSTKNNNQKIQSIDYALVFNKAKISIFQKGKFIGKLGNVKVGDVLTVERKGNKILYKKNDKLIRRRPTNPQQMLYVDVAIKTSGASLSGIEVTFLKPLKITYAKQDVVCGSGAVGSIDITVTGGAPPYSYSWTSDSWNDISINEPININSLTASPINETGNEVTAEDLSGLEKGKYTVIVTDQNGKTAHKTIQIQVPAIWAYLDGALQNSEGITKGEAKGWNAGATSYNELLADESGFVEYKVESTNEVKAFGLSVSTANIHFQSLAYGILFKGTRVVVVEAGKLIGFYGKCKEGDKFKIVRKNGKVLYKRNGRAFRKAPIIDSQRLRAAVVLYSEGSSFYKVKTNFCNVSLVITINTEELGIKGQGSIRYAGADYAHTFGGITQIPISPADTYNEARLLINEENGAFACLFDVHQSGIKNVRGELMHEGELYEAEIEDENYYLVQDHFELVLYPFGSGRKMYEVDVYIPLEEGLALTPNNDGEYDVFQVVGLPPDIGYSVVILDEEGSVVFESDQAEITWDPLSNDNTGAERVYTYELTIDSEKLTGSFLVNK